MHFVVSEIAKVIKKDIPYLSNENVLFEQPDFRKSGLKFPLAVVYETGFKVEPGRFDRWVEEAKEQKRDVFSGDGVNTRYRLTNTPISGIRNVECPAGIVKGEKLGDFRLDPTKSIITFSSPPPAGNENIIVEYHVVKNSKEVIGLDLNVICCVDLWTENKDQSDSVSIDILTTLFRRMSDFNKKRINIVPIEGLPIHRDYDSKNDMVTGYGRKLMFRADVEIRVDLKKPRKRIHPLIARIHIAEK